MQQEANLSNRSIPPTELIITEDGRIYHLDLLPEGYKIGLGFIQYNNKLGNN